MRQNRVQMEHEVSAEDYNGENYIEMASVVDIFILYTHLEIIN